MKKHVEVMPANAICLLIIMIMIPDGWLILVLLLTSIAIKIYTFT